MTPTERLVEKLNLVLLPHDVEIRHIDSAQGYWRQADVMRWEGWLQPTRPDYHQTLWTIGSWDTITDCLRYGFDLIVKPYRGEADILVHSRKP